MKDPELQILPAWVDADNETRRLGSQFRHGLDLLNLP
jgi:hypothetical protein